MAPYLKKTVVNHRAGLRGFVQRLGVSLGGVYWRGYRGDAMVAAYANSLARRLPIMAILLVLGLAAIQLRYVGTVHWQWLVPGMALSVLTFAQGWHWLPRRVEARSLDRRARDLAWLPLDVGMRVAIAVAWALLLYLTGNESQRTLVQVLLAMLSVVGLFGFAHHPATSTRIVLVSVLPSITVFLYTDGWNALPVSLVLIGVNAALAIVAFSYHADFVRLELSRQQLARRERTAARLADAHSEQALRDALTGGLNRRGILARIKQELADGPTRGAGMQPWLALIDLDGFKHINDTYGHAAGDDVLRAVAARIDTIAGVVAHGRLGGDEFAILFDGALDEAGVGVAAHNLAQAVRQPVAHNNVLLRLHASTGLHRMEGADLGPCLERADAALYKAKARGEGAIVVFGDDDEVALAQRAFLTRRFNDCALDARLRVLYQPFFDNDSGALMGFEAFARWSPDGQTWLAPADFLDLANATGRTGELTRAVLSRALAECEAWRDGLTLAVNLTPRDVTREGAVEALTALVRAAGADPSCILLEMNEKALLGDPRRALAQMQAFHAAGFRLALDDFGAGWSSLSQLRDLPFDMVKIDRALATALTTDPGARAIVSTIVTLAWQLDMECLIEGIETEAQAATARALGIRLMQGYHFSRPASALVAQAMTGRAVA